MLRLDAVSLGSRPISQYEDPGEVLFAKSHGLLVRRGGMIWSPLHSAAVATGSSQTPLLKAA
jgi:hypothetical protein